MQASTNDQGLKTTQARFSFSSEEIVIWTGAMSTYNQALEASRRRILAVATAGGQTNAGKPVLMTAIHGP